MITTRILPPRPARTTALVFVLLIAGYASRPALASTLIDFETTPGGVLPSDNLILLPTTPYVFGSLQVTFGFDADLNGSVDSNAVFEEAGINDSPNVGFSGSSGVNAADPGFGLQLGSYFLRSSSPGSNFGRFIIKYTTLTPVTAASGEIWDIDGIEQQLAPPLTEWYRVQAFGATHNLLGTIDSPIGVTNDLTSLDGQPWAFSFSGLSAGIDQIEVTFIGSKTTGIGLAFNNFYPDTALPEPSTLNLAGFGMLGLLGFARRRAKRFKQATGPT